jgi:hypothetical protein
METHLVPLYDSQSGPATTNSSAGEARPTYHVGSEKWSDFERYLTLASVGLKNAKASKEARPLIVATRRYLQATFARGNVFPEWETESMAIEHPASYEGMIDVREDRSDVLEDLC